MNFGYEIKRRLNEDFFQHARIIGAVSILYYPFVDEKYTYSHCEIEIENDCYSFCNQWSRFKRFPGCYEIPEVGSYRKRVSRHHRHFPYPYDPFRQRPYWHYHSAFIRFFISVTPNQLRIINNNIKKIRSISGLTCMEAVNRFLKRYCNYAIPFPICLYPCWSGTWLGVTKEVFGSRRITLIDTEIFDKSHPKGSYDPVASMWRYVRVIGTITAFALSLLLGFT